MCELRCAMRKPWSPRVPSWAVRLGACLMGTEGELALAGRRCLPERLVEQHFKFLYTNLESALADIFAEKKSPVVSHQSPVKDEGSRLLSGEAAPGASRV
jgi:hypothetical protein